MSTPAGYITPTTTSFPNGAGNPRDASVSMGQQMNAKQSSINAIGGRRRRKRNTKRGGGVAAPQYQMSYTPTGGPGTNPNDQIAGMTSTSMQSTAWKVNDSKATSMSGGNPNWNWGCYSGGLKRKKTTCHKRKRRTRRTRRKRR